MGDTAADTHTQTHTHAHQRINTHTNTNTEGENNSLANPFGARLTSHWRISLFL